MAKIWSDIELEWEGNNYVVRPSMEFVNHLERKDGRSLSKMFQRMMTKDLPSGAACELIADTLRYAGADVTAEEVFAETGGGVGVAAVEMAAAILIACMPAPKSSNTVTNSKKKPTTSRRKSTGAKSTG